MDKEQFDKGDRILMLLMKLPITQSEMKSITGFKKKQMIKRLKQNLFQANGTKLYKVFAKYNVNFEWIETGIGSPINMLEAPKASETQTINITV